MAIHHIEHHVSDGLAREIASHTPLDRAAFDAAFASVQQYLGAYADSILGQELLRHVAPAGPALAILDVGAGGGRSSFFLHSLGHRVSVVEPSPVLCAQIAYASARFAVPLDIYTVTAEEMHRLPLRNLDAVLFNSSLHHCDDPVAALRSAFTLLRGHGRVVVAHEPHLRFYRTRRQYQRQLADRPLQSGHYGGNEHIYYHHEYLRMLAQAGFCQVSSSLDVRNLRPRLAIEDLVQRKVRGQPVYSAEALLLRLGWLVLLARLLRLPLLGALVERALKALSLAAISYQGVKPA